MDWDADRDPLAHAPGDPGALLWSAQTPHVTDVGAEIIAGLSEPQARVSPKFFYDALGSRLFEAITALPEYYPCRAEIALLETHSAAIASALGTGRTVIELGAGCCEKATCLFPSLQPAHTRFGPCQNLTFCAHKKMRFLVHFSNNQRASRSRYFAAIHTRRKKVLSHKLGLRQLDHLSL